MSIYDIHPITLGKVHTYPLASRKSKVSTRDFAKPHGANSSLAKFLDSLPHILAAQDLRQLLSLIQAARKKRKAILWGLGGHVIKVGLGPVLIDLMKRGFITGIAMNGAALIHDFEIALAGNTSEDVDAGLSAGQFGMAAETGEYLNEMAKLSHRIRIGYGEAAGQFLTSGVVEHQASRLQRSDRRLQRANSCHRASRDWHRHPAHAPRGGWRGARCRNAPGFPSLLRACPADATGRRLHELGFGGAAAGSFLKSRIGSSQPGSAAPPHHHGEL